jgi:hypothetical protein
LFIWNPGEYVAELTVQIEPGSTSVKRRYRFTVFESDSALLKKYVDDYKYGGGISYNDNKHVGVFLPIEQQTG